jgi:predicted enzyme related to lactoylglutathione lyase
MKLASIRILTENLDRLIGFYEQVTSIKATRYTPDFAELVTPGGTLALAHVRTMEMFGTGGAQAAANRSAIIELRVDDVDRTFDQIASAIGEPVQRPTTMPWGNRSLLFRDPDGNLLNFFAPVTADAKKKLGD